MSLRLRTCLFFAFLAMLFLVPAIVVAVLPPPEPGALAGMPPAAGSWTTPVESMSSRPPVEEPMPTPGALP